LVGGKPINDWRYELNPVGGGTDVTESFRRESTAANRAYWMLLGRCSDAGEAKPIVEECARRSNG